MLSFASKHSYLDPISSSPLSPRLYQAATHKLIKAPRINPRDSNSAGLSKFPHSAQRGHSLLPLRRRHQSDQPRLLGRSQRHRIPHPLRAPSILHLIHRLHPLEASARRNAAAVALVTRSRWNGDQCDRTGISYTLFHLLLLPNGYAGRGGDDELEYRHVWGDLPMGYGLLRREGEEGVYSSGKDCQTGRLACLLEAVSLEKIHRGGRGGRTMYLAPCAERVCRIFLSLG